MQALTIGKVARLADVGVETIRFYEREGLIDKPPRRDSGYRQYPQDTVSRLRFIRRAKELGFTLNEIKELLSLRLSSETTCEDIRLRAEAKLSDIEAKIRTLRRMKSSLVKLTQACRVSAEAQAGRKGTVSACPILEALDEDDQ